MLETCYVGLLHLTHWYAVQAALAVTAYLLTGGSPLPDDARRRASTADLSWATLDDLLPLSDANA